MPVSQNDQEVHIQALVCFRKTGDQPNRGNPSPKVKPHVLVILTTIYSIDIMIGDGLGPHPSSCSAKPRYTLPEKDLGNIGWVDPKEVKEVPYNSIHKDPHPSFYKGCHGITTSTVCLSVYQSPNSQCCMVMLAGISY